MSLPIEAKRALGVLITKSSSKGRLVTSDREERLLLLARDVGHLGVYIFQVYLIPKALTHLLS